MAYRKTPAELARLAERKAGMVEAAIAVLGKDGLDGDIVGNIAARAGIAKGAIYHYFADKDELINAAVTELMAEHVAMLNAASRGDGDKMLATVIRTYIEIAGKSRRIMPVLRASPLYRNALKSAFRNFIAEARPHGRYDDALVRAGVVLGAIWETAAMVSRDEAVLASMLLSAINCSHVPARAG